MKRVGVNRSFEEQVQYHLDDGRAPEFIVTQRDRVQLARFLVDKIIDKEWFVPCPTIVELGCGAGDISGPYATDDRRRVIGYDVTPAAEEACNTRWPRMEFHLQPVEEVEPLDCDILVMTEFLEHVEDPEKIVRAWLPKARWAVIGHPLDEPDPPIEPGHIWSYTREDWRAWFKMGGHQWREEFRFPMGPWDAMILGHSSRVLKPLG